MMRSHFRNTLIDNTLTPAACSRTIHGLTIAHVMTGTCLGGTGGGPILMCKTPCRIPQGRSGRGAANISEGSRTVTCAKH